MIPYSCRRHGGAQLEFLARIPTRCAPITSSFCYTLRREHSALDVRLEVPTLSDWPLEKAPDAAIVSALCDVLSDRGLSGTPAGVDFGSNASKVALAGIPSVIFGPGSIDQAHTVDKYVDIDQVEQAFLIYGDLMLRFE